ncbi:uncharacterized protein TrAFT101_009044 [Trichoderma asperellum]|uniref:uncharacterized protein n=1 Tax=Trichoderma asperellum TaxID=101201 RepID=UPI003323FC8F|nr:hypothetical protein TrAFT101_009044 [Trichoderma asperellum]
MLQLLIHLGDGLAVGFRSWPLVWSGYIGTQFRTASDASIRYYPAVMVSGLGAASLPPYLTDSVPGKSLPAQAAKPQP